MSPPTPRERRFTESLEELAKKEDRASLAALRRGLGKPAGEAAEMYPYVVPFLADESSQVRQHAYYVVASLFAWHQLAWHPGDDGRSTNLGASFARLKSVTDSDSIEKRFVALLNSHRDDLSEHLRHAVGLLKAHEVPIDWPQLLHDLQGWDWESRSVQRDWAGAYWGSPSVGTGSAADAAGAEPTGVEQARG